MALYSRKPSKKWRMALQHKGLRAFVGASCKFPIAPVDFSNRPFEFCTVYAQIRAWMVQNYRLRYMPYGRDGGIIQTMPASPVKELSAHLPPRTLAVRDFWRKWQARCRKEFGDCPEELACIDRLQRNVATEPMFTHLDEGLENLLLSNRSADCVHLTHKAWFALSWVVLHAFVYEHAHKTPNASRQKETRKAVASALDRIRVMFILSRGQAIDGVTPQDWVDKGPWANNPALWTLLFQHGLHLVHPEREPLYWALRARWVAIGPMHPTLESNALHALESPPDLAAWCFPKEMTLSSVRNVLCSGRRWALRAKNNMHETLDACVLAPDWQSVYLFSIWLSRQDNHVMSTPEELALLDPYMEPAHLVFWLALTHDEAHQAIRPRNVFDTFALDESPQYSAVCNMLTGLQIFEKLPEVELALSAWLAWNNTANEEVTPLPELG